MNDNLPVSTKWLLDAVGDTGRNTVTSVFLIYCQKTNSKGTGFLLESGQIITNEHVVRDCSENEVVALASDGSKIYFTTLITDNKLDLAALIPINTLTGGLKISKDKMDIGIQVNTWGYPLSYNGPSPILSIGYSAGFNETKNGTKHIVINGAFNSGNSGGPLFKAGSEEVIGVVVTKHQPFPKKFKVILEHLSNSHDGMWVDIEIEGKKEHIGQAQFLADYLKYLNSLLQVNIGEAIEASELISFLATNKFI